MDKSQRLEALYERIRNDPLYHNESMGAVFVPGKGTLEDRSLVFVGEAPGRDEERAASPFVGAAGRNLTELLDGIGIARDSVFITNLLKYRPMTPKGENRSPTAAESRLALPYLFKELEILAPRIVVCLGLSSARAVLESPALKMSEANGHVLPWRGGKMVVAYHPSPYNYKSPRKKEAMRGAFETLKSLWVEKDGPATVDQERNVHF